LPSAAIKTLGKEIVCRVSKKTLGKDGVCRVFSFLHSAKEKIFFLGKKEKKKNEKKIFAECPDLGYSAK